MWLTVLVIAIAAAMMMAVQEVPVMASSEIISTDYNIIELDAPALAGVLLTFVTRIATRTVLRPFIVRFMLNKNEVHLIREPINWWECPPHTIPWRGCLQQTMTIMCKQQPKPRISCRKDYHLLSLATIDLSWTITRSINPARQPRCKC